MWRRLAHPWTRLNAQSAPSSSEGCLDGARRFAVPLVGPFLSSAARLPPMRRPPMCRRPTAGPSAVSHIFPTWAEFSPNLIEVRPSLTHFGQSRPKRSRIWPKSVKIAARFSKICPDVDQSRLTSGKLCSSLADLRQFGGRMSRTRLKLVSMEPQVARVGAQFAKFGPMLINFGRVRTNLAKQWRIQARFHQIWQLDLGQVLPTSAGFGQHRDSFGQQRSMSGQTWGSCRRVCRT